MRRFLHQHRYTIVVALALSVTVLWQSMRATDALIVRALNVGQGDATLIRSPNGTQVLIDAGPNNAVLSELGKAMPFWDRTLDLVVLTHPDFDHLAGFKGVMDRYRVSHVLFTGAAKELDQYAAFLAAVEGRHVPYTLAQAGERIRLGNAVMEVVWPLDIVAGSSSKATNDYSIVLRLVYGNTSFLFTGDEEGATEERLLASGAPIDADVLKVGHHGSKNASTDAFLAAVSPKVALIEVGAENRYGHPAPELLQRLNDIHATIFRTDRDGAVTIETDGKKVSRVTQKTCILIYCPQVKQTLFTE